MFSSSVLTNFETEMRFLFIQNMTAMRFRRSYLDEKNPHPSIEFTKVNSYLSYCKREILTKNIRVQHNKFLEIAEHLKFQKGCNAKFLR